MLEQPPWGHCWRFSRGYRQVASLIYAPLPTEVWTRFLLTWIILWFFRLLFLPENTAYWKALFSWDIKILSGKLFCSSPFVCVFSACFLIIYLVRGAAKCRSTRYWNTEIFYFPYNFLKYRVKCSHSVFSSLAVLCFTNCTYINTVTFSAKRNFVFVICRVGGSSCVLHSFTFWLCSL